MGWFSMYQVVLQSGFWQNIFPAEFRHFVLNSGVSRVYCTWRLIARATTGLLNANARTCEYTLQWLRTGPSVWMVLDGRCTSFFRARVHAACGSQTKLDPAVGWRQFFKWPLHLARLDAHGKASWQHAAIRKERSFASAAARMLEEFGIPHHAWIGSGAGTPHISTFRLGSPEIPPHTRSAKGMSVEGHAPAT